MTHEASRVGRLEPVYGLVAGPKADLKEALKGDDKATIEDKSNALMAASQKLGEKMYADMQAKEAAGQAAAGADAGSAKPADDNVVDAEVKEVKKG